MMETPLHDFQPKLRQNKQEIEKKKAFFQQNRAAGKTPQKFILAEMITKEFPKTSIFYDIFVIYF